MSLILEDFTASALRKVKGRSQITFPPVASRPVRADGTSLERGCTLLTIASPAPSRTSARAVHAMRSLHHPGRTPNAPFIGRGMWWLWTLLLGAVVAPVRAAESADPPPVFVMRIAGAI